MLSFTADIENKGEGVFLVGFYKKHGVFCAHVEEQKIDTGMHIVYEPFVADNLVDLLLKLHAKYGSAIEDVDPDELVCVEAH